MTRSALITGITGQDGSYLAEFLLDRGYRVAGLTRRTSTVPGERIAHLVDRIELVPGDMLDQDSLTDALAAVQPDEVYNLAGHSFVPASWKQPVLTGEFTALGVTRLLEALRHVNPRARFYQAGSSEMFGMARHEPQDEDTPLAPRSPYGVAKAYGHWITVNYREAHGIFAVGGILYNHESPRRGTEFVTRKISAGVARIAHGLAGSLRLGNLDAARDWGFAGDYVRAMWMMLNAEKPADYVIGTGTIHTVREFCEVAFSRAGLDYRDHVEVDPALARPTETHQLRADPARAMTSLGWVPEVGFTQLVEMMVDADLERIALGT